MKNYRIIKEEFSCTIDEIAHLETQIGFKFPNDYKQFLLEFNGGSVLPTQPDHSKSKVYIFPIERFFSVGDLSLPNISNLIEIKQLIKEDYNDSLQKIDVDKLLFIAICERGHIAINCDYKNYGQICYINFSGGEGLEISDFKSFTELLNSLVHFDPEEPFDIYAVEEYQPLKIFEFSMYYFWNDGFQKQTLQRFVEVLNFYGDPNTVNPIKNYSVVEHYINNPIVLEYLLENGGKVPEKLKRVNNIESIKILKDRGANLDGLLLTSRNFKVIKFLIEEVKQDINQQYEGEYPMIAQTWLSPSSANSKIKQFELIKDIASLPIEINLTLKDDEGRTVKERIEILKNEYLVYAQKYPYAIRK